jgi:hypothetical protein
MAPYVPSQRIMGNDPLVNTSYVNVRTVVASLVTVVLASLLAVCPLTACVIAPDSSAAPHGCCHKAHPQPGHCPLPTVQDCPYFILEKGKITQTGSAISKDDFQPVMPDFRVLDQFSIIRSQTRLADSTGLYLRLRMLLI